MWSLDSTQFETHDLTHRNNLTDHHRRDGFKCYHHVTTTTTKKKKANWWSCKKGIQKATHKLRNCYQVTYFSTLRWCQTGECSQHLELKLSQHFKHTLHAPYLHNWSLIFLSPAPRCLLTWFANDSLVCKKHSFTLDHVFQERLVFLIQLFSMQKVFC